MTLLEMFLKNEIGINDTDSIVSTFNNYNKLILEWNKKVNLVSRKSDSIETHIINSIFFLTKHPLNGEEKIIDIGTGGGFPGIPLKILYPKLDLTLIDSIQKKTTALEDIISKLALKNVEVVTGRAEEISKKPGFNYSYDLAVSKAVTVLDNLYEWGKGFLKNDGSMICIKGGDISEEIAELSKNYPAVKTETIDYSFSSEYNIEDKKIVIISK